ncbi:MAG TPA: energy transducer TonB [Pyrinomonadaceae bacterium]
MPRTLTLLLVFALLAGCAADARAQSGVRLQQQQPPAAPPRNIDTAEAQQSCERGHELVNGDTSAARETLGRGLKLYIDAYIRNAPAGPGRAVATDFRETMRARLKGAPPCVDDYLRVGGADGFERAQLEAFRAHALLFAETDESRAIYLSAEVDERAHITRKPEPGFPAGARGKLSRGTVRLRAVLAADGTVQHPFVLKGVAYGFSELCVAAARKIQFTPSVRNGRPVSQFVTLEYNFSTY